MDSTSLNTIVTIVGIIVTIFGIGFFREYIWKTTLGILGFIFPYLVLKNYYYSSPFVLNKIEKSKNIIRIMCVRNERVSEPDNIEAFKEFLSNGGTLEILSLDPSFSDCITNECMKVLPAPPESQSQFSQQVNTNIEKIATALKDSCKHKESFVYSIYCTLPIMHLCQFDDNIYLGFQLLFRNKIDESLLAYSVRIKVASMLGRLLVEQFKYVKDHKSKQVVKY